MLLDSLIHYLVRNITFLGSGTLNDKILLVRSIEYYKNDAYFGSGQEKYWLYLLRLVRKGIKIGPAG